MSHEHELYIQLEGADEPKPIKVNDDETIAMILARLRAEHPGFSSDPELVAVFAEDGDDEAHHGKRVCECHPHRPRILHCHRCREVKVTVHYNGEASRAFRPNARIRRVTEWAKKHFGVDEGRKWVLRSGSAEGEIQDRDAHLGRLVTYPHCHVTFYLTEECLIQG